MNGNFNKILEKALDEEHKREHLKKCPFCGGDAEIFSTRNYLKKTFYRIHCKEFCCLQVHFYLSEIDAVEAWNRRANDD